MIRVAVLGTGFIANIFMKNIVTVDAYEVTSVLAISQEDGEKFSKEYGVQKIYTDYSELLQDQDIDLVYIGLPNNLHYPFALKALEASKSVILEKPFVPTIAEFDSLLNKAKQNNVFLFDAITTRHVPNLKIVKEKLAQLGPIKIVNASYCQYSSKYTDYVNGKMSSVFTPKTSGGALFDLGVYNITLMITLFGKPNSSSYIANRLDNGVDSSGILTLGYDGFIASCIQAKDCFTENYVMIQGEKGTLLVDDDCFRFPNVRFRKNNKEEENIGITMPFMAMHYELQDFSEIILKGDFEANHALLSETRNVIEILEKFA